MARWRNLDDIQRAANRRLPRMIADFIGGGAEDERTLRANRSDFSKLTLRPRVLSNVSDRKMGTTVLGTPVALPVLLSPAGLARLAHPEGELAAARAAGKAGSVFIAGTGASCTIEDTAAAATGPAWFQLYPWRDRSVVESIIERARASGYTTLVVTVDVPIVGKRERDLANGMTVPPRIGISSAFDAARHPRWLWSHFTRPGVTLANFVGSAEGDKLVEIATYINTRMVNPAMSWNDFVWIKELWGGPVAVKGILTGADTDRAIAHGADGIIVSNHGGRQLDGAPSTIQVLSEVVDAANGRAEVLIDGGVRRGSDVVKALALGAKACLVGRPWVWALAAGGEAGVERMFEIIAEEIDRVMALLGRSSLADLDHSVLGPGAGSPPWNFGPFPTGLTDPRPTRPSSNHEANKGE